MSISLKYSAVNVGLMLDKGQNNMTPCYAKLEIPANFQQNSLKNFTNFFEAKQ